MKRRFRIVLTRLNTPRLRWWARAILIVLAVLAVAYIVALALVAHWAGWQALP